MPRSGGTQGAQADGLQRLARLRLLPAYRVQYTLTLDAERYANELGPWTHLLDGDKLYVRVPNVACSYSDLIQQAADAVGAGLAQLFRGVSRRRFRPPVRQRQAGAATSALAVNRVGHR